MRQRKFIDDGLFIGSLAVALGVAALIAPAHAQQNPQPSEAQAQPMQTQPMQAQPAVPAPTVNVPETPAEAGMVRTQDTRLRVTYMLPDTDMSRFRTINLHALSIPPDAADATPTNARTRGRESFILGDREISALQAAFAQSVRSVLGNAGYTFVDTPQADTLIVAPQVTDITLAAPIEATRMSGRTRTYTQGAGSITVSAVLADGGSGQVLGVAAARSRPTNIWRLNNRVTNMADARNAFNDWARSLRDTMQGRYSGR